MAVTLNRDQRDALHRTVLDELADASGVGQLVRAGEAERARFFGLYFSALFRLLDDLGWTEQDERESFELSLPPNELERVAERLLDYADQTPAESRPSKQDENLGLRTVATAILEDLREEGGG
jgi:hypothetical protein